MPVWIGNGYQNPYRTVAVARRNVLDGYVVPGVKGVRSGSTHPEPRQLGGAAPRKRPLGCRAIGVLHEMVAGEPAIVGKVARLFRNVQVNDRDRMDAQLFQIVHTSHCDRGILTSREAKFNS